MKLRSRFPARITLNVNTLIRSYPVATALKMRKQNGTQSSSQSDSGSLILQGLGRAGWIGWIFWHWRGIDETEVITAVVRCVNVVCLVFLRYFLTGKQVLMLKSFRDFFSNVRLTSGIDSARIHRLPLIQCTRKAGNARDA
ncbi:hypothetical protein [Gimesia sp.]|uniref:hypothetical protein n=1 Tax=Gimesia sp. TaxID=2024833 RepID=UPI003A8EFC88